MKIALIAGDDLTQNPRVRWEARALAATGHRVTVYGVLSSATEEEEDEAGVVYVRVPRKGWQATGGGERPLVVRNCPPFHEPKRGDALRKKLGAFPTDKLLLFLGPLTEGCGIDTAIRALKLLGDRHLLVVMGRLPRLTKFEKLAEEE